MITIKMNGQPVDFPTQATELSLKQFFDLKKARTTLDEICAIAGVDRETFSNFKSTKDLNYITALMNNLSDKIKSGINGHKLPKQVEMSNKVIQIPSSLRLEPVGAFMSVSDIIAEEINRATQANIDVNITDRIPEILGHYLFSRFNPDAPYSDESVDDPEYMAAVMSIKFADAVPIANFFFRKFPNFS